MKDGRDKRSGEGVEGVWQVQDCMTVSSKEEGIWEYKYEIQTITSNDGIYLLPGQMVGQRPVGCTW